MMHAITRRDVIYRAIRRRLTHVMLRALTRAASLDSGRPHTAAAVRVLADYTLLRRRRRHGLLRRVLPLPLLLADAYVTQRVNCLPTRSTVACRDVTTQGSTRHTAHRSVV